MLHCLKRHLPWVLCVAVVAGCGGSGEPRVPTLTRSYRLPARGDRVAVGAGGRVYYTVSGGSPMGRPMGGPRNELQLVEANSKPGYPLKLEPGTQIKTVLADDKGLLYVGVREAGKDQLWVFPEQWEGKTPEAKAKLTPELPGDLNGLFLGRESGTLFALCGDKWIVELKTDGTVARTIELPGDSRPEDGGIDAQGNLYVRRTSGPVVKVKPDGTVDRAWAKTEAAAITSVRSVAVDSRGLVYVAASEGDVSLRAFDSSGALVFNILTEELKYAPERILVTPRDVLYAVEGAKVLEFRP